MSGTSGEWIGVADVAAEMKLSDKAAWELLRRLGVPRLEPGRAVLAQARFRRADWEAARDGAVRPPTPRVSKPVASSAPSPARSKAAAASKLARLRGA